MASRFQGTRGGARRVATAALLGLLAATYAASIPAVAADPAVAVAADLSVESGRTRLTLTVSRSVPVTAFLLERPDRAVIELPEVNFQLGDAGQRRAGLVSSFRSGVVAPGRSRLVVDLTGPATVAVLPPAEEEISGATLLTVEFTRTDRETFRKLAQDDRLDLVLTTGALAAVPSGRDMRPAIAIDAGHGGADTGAKAVTGLLEKNLTLAFAEGLRARLAETGRYRVVMIREGDVFVPLDERVRKAREAGADLFLSIHADTISNPFVSGATLYTGSDRATDLESANLAERENAADAAGGHNGPAPPPAVTDILQDLTVRETRGFSHRVSGLLLRDLGKVMRFSSHPQREAGFRVLRNPDVPSVLVELGYLSNARDLERLSSAEWRASVATRMVRVIETFFASRTVARAAMSP